VEYCASVHYKSDIKKRRRKFCRFLHAMDPRTRNLAYRDLVAIKMHVWSHRERERGEFAQENLWHAVQIELSCRARRRRRRYRDEKTRRGKDGISYSEGTFKEGLNIVASLGVTRYRGRKGLEKWTKPPAPRILLNRSTWIISWSARKFERGDAWWCLKFIRRAFVDILRENAQ